MIPKLPKNNGKGASFKAAAQYYLHDKRDKNGKPVETSERVEWTQTINLAVDDPDLAWRIMAATALDKERLKQQAGVKRTGRKSHLDVLHFSLSWHPEQKESLTREEMMRAAHGALKALGAQNHQTLVVAHNDEPQPHVHLIVNRVSPENGVMLSDSYTKLKLSDWAEAYEKEEARVKEGAEVYCKNRVINNQRRRRGQFVRHGDVPRHIFEERRNAAANDNDRAQAVAAEQRRKDAALALKSRNQASLQRRAQQSLLEAHKERKAALARELQRRIQAQQTAILEAYRPKWLELNEHQRSERATFEALEKSALGRATNVARTLSLTGKDIGGETSNVISRSFRILTQAGVRKEYFEKAQEAARASLQRDEDAQVRQAAAELREAQRAKLAANRARFLEERDQLAQTQAAQNEAMQAQWRTRTAERKSAYQDVKPSPQAERKIMSQQDIVRLQALDEVRRMKHKPANDAETPPAPPKSHKVDFDQVSRDLKGLRDKGNGHSQSDDDMDI